MNLASPWAVQIAMLPVRRQPPDGDPPAWKEAIREKRRWQRTQTENAILRALRRRPGLSTKELAHAIGMSAEWVRAAIQPLVQTGQVEFFTARSALKYWRLPDGQTV